MMVNPLSSLRHTQCLLDTVDDSPSFTCYVSRRSQMEIGVVYDPCSDELFQAVRGYGSFVNGQRVSSSTCSELGGAVVVSEILHLLWSLSALFNTRSLQHGFFIWKHSPKSVLRLKSEKGDTKIISPGSFIEYLPLVSHRLPVKSTGE